MRHREQTTRLIAVAVAIGALVTIALSTFAWPAARLEPRDLPVGVVGPAPERLTEDHGFEVHRYPDKAAARQAIEEREVYGAVVGQTLLTASAASPTVAALLERELAPAGGTRVVDVVPADPDDPRGAAFSNLALPLTFVSILTGVIVAVTTRPGLLQAGVLVGGALLAGVVAIAVVQGWLGVLEGDWWANAGVIALVILAMAGLVAGLMAVLGHHGAALAALLMVFVGNPWSGVSSAPELLPGWVGSIGQLLPPGAGGSLLRSSAFFDGNGGGGPLAVLLAWALFGLAAISAGAMRAHRTAATRVSTQPA
jgi:hypothetical protein